jgi:hypothetical protein
MRNASDGATGNIMALTVYTNAQGVPVSGDIVWRERLIHLNDVYMIRVCGTKMEVIYKERPAEKIVCTQQEIQDIVNSLNNDTRV